MNNQALEINFHKDMLNIYEEARKVGYNASRFIQMVANQGGLNVAKKFIQNSNPSDGFVSLWELNRLDLTVESLILKGEYESLFSASERQIVIKRLKEYGFEIPQEQSYVNVNTWIFQGNPRVFDIDKYVKNNKFIWWSLRQEHFADKVQLNDDVFLWRSDGGNRGTGGILAKCKVVSLPQERANDDSAKEYWHTDDMNQSGLVVKLEVLEVRPSEGFISRKVLLDHEILKDLLIHRLRQQTNYSLSDEHATELDKLWSSYTGEQKVDIPDLEPKARSREYNNYKHEIRDKVIYEYLFNARTRRWLDENIIGMDANYSRGYQSMGILHYIGLKDKHKGLFKGMNISDAVAELTQSRVSDFKLVIASLKRFSKVVDDDNNRNDTVIDEEKEYAEGKEAYRIHRFRERDARLVQEAKKLFKQKHGELFCKACGINFEKVYGERGKDFIEAHHTKPVSEMKEGEKTKVEDIAMLCSNCHRIIHRKPTITVEELKDTIN